MLNKLVADFELRSTGDKKFRLSSETGRNIVIYFYPRDDTPGCTVEGQDFRDHYNEFVENNCSVIGISRDSLESHEKFKKKMDFPFELLSDADEVVCQIFGVMKDKNMYGKQVRGIERSTFVVNDKGVLIREWRGVKVPGHVVEVLDFVKTLRK